MKKEFQVIGCGFNRQIPCGVAMASGVVKKNIPTLFGELSNRHGVHPAVAAHAGPEDKATLGLGGVGGDECGFDGDTTRHGMVCPVYFHSHSPKLCKI